MKTKTLSLLVAFVLVGLSAAHAQFTVGGKLGFNYSSFPTTATEVKNKGGAAGFDIGAFARIGNKTYFQPEFLYSNTGGKFTLGGVTYKPSFNQIDIPLMVGFKLLKLPLLNVHASLGPDLIYNLNKSAGYSYGAKAVNLKKAIVGGVINAGVDVGNIVIDARYNLGFTKIDNGVGATLGVFNLSVGFKFL